MSTTSNDERPWDALSSEEREAIKNACSVLNVWIAKLELTSVYGHGWALIATDLIEELYYSAEREGEDNDA